MSEKIPYNFLNGDKFANAVKKHGLDLAQVQAAAVAAIQAKPRAYCAYSKFRVGAALLTKTTLPITSVVNAAPTTGSPPLKDQSSHAQPTDKPGDSSAQQIISGGNLENGSYGVGTCAERVAFATAMMLGHVGRPADDGRGIAAVIVTADLDEPISPCGACRQFMSEFLPASTPVFMFGREENLVEMTMGELLPFPFDK